MNIKIASMVVILIIFTTSITFNTAYGKMLLSNKNILEENESKIKNGKIDKDILKKIYSSLKYTSEYFSHNMRGADNNVYIHPKLGYVVVENKKTKEILKNDINMGVYSFYIAEDSPLKHYSMDIVPWLLLGRYKEDDTNICERIDAFSKDFGTGVLKSIEKTKQEKNALPDSLSDR